MNQFAPNMKTWLLAIFVGCTLSIYARKHNNTDSYYNHLFEINKEWIHHIEACPKGVISFNSDVDRIQLHLNLVIQHLKSNIPSNLNSIQLANRLHLLDGLQQYADKKIFPINKYHTVRTPYFVDNIGTNCAVGQMIYLSGNKQLVAKISKEHNYDYIKDIKTEGIKEWANEFGFTIEELKWIQPAYGPNAIIEQVLGGANGSINKIEYNPRDASLTIAGAFTELNNLPCLSIGTYKNNQLTCVGSGVDGIIHEVIHRGDSIFVFGEIHDNGRTYPAAKYDGSNWTYLSIPNRDGAIASSAIAYYKIVNYSLNYRLEMVISHDSIPEHQEIWLLANNTWTKKAKVKGVILTIERHQGGRIYAGHFDTAIIYNYNFTPITTLTVNNVLFNTYSQQWFGIGNEISDSVNVIADIGGALLFGGTCINKAGSSKVCISRYYNSTLQPIFLNYDTVSYTVNTIAYNYGLGSKFAFGGYFRVYPFGIGSYGSHLATYDLAFNWIEPLADFDNTVNSIFYIDNQLYIGGEFQKNLGNQMNFLARHVGTVGRDELASGETLEVFPNPFTNLIHLEGIESAVNYSILNLNGQILKSGKVIDKEINNLDFLPNGVFLLRLDSEKGSILKKIVK